MKVIREHGEWVFNLFAKGRKSVSPSKCERVENPFSIMSPSGSIDKNSTQ